MACSLSQPYYFPNKSRLGLGIAVPVISIPGQKAQLQRLIFMGQRRIAVKIVPEKDFIIITVYMKMDMEHPLGIAAKGISFVETHACP